MCAEASERLCLARSSLIHACASASSAEPPTKDLGEGATCSIWSLQVRTGRLDARRDHLTALREQLGCDGTSTGAHQAYA